MAKEVKSDWTMFDRNTPENQEKMQRLINFLQELSDNRPGVAIGLAKTALEDLTEMFGAKLEEIPREALVRKIGEA